MYQILDNVHDLQKNMDLLLRLQESHFEDVEDIGADLRGLEVGVEETKDGILQSIEKNSNAVREKTDRIVGAANATMSAVFWCCGSGWTCFGAWWCCPSSVAMWISKTGKVEGCTERHATRKKVPSTRKRAVGCAQRSSCNVVE